MDKEDVYIAIDTEFESENVILGNILQLGFVVFVVPQSLTEEDLKKGEWIREKESFCFTDQFKDKQGRVMDFWSKFPEIHKRIQEEALPIDEQFEKIQIWLNSMYSKYNVKHYVADHSAVDFPWFKNLYQSLNVDSLSNDNFRLPWKCLCTFNMKQVLLELGCDINDIYKQTTTEVFPHTHYATEDALQTAYEYLSLLRLIREIQRI